MSETNNFVDTEAARVGAEDIRVGNGHPRPCRSHSDRFNPINITFETAFNNYNNNMPFADYGDHSFTQLDSSVGSFRFCFNNQNRRMVSASEEVDPESGQLEETRHNNISSSIYDIKHCRICHMNAEDGGDGNNDDESVMENSGAVMELGCNCKGDMSIAHQRCAVTWFRIKGNRTCEICGATAQNVCEMAHIDAFEQRLQAVNEDAEHEAIEASLNGAIFIEPETTRSVNGRGVLNFLLGSMVMAFIIPWLIHFNAAH